MTISVDWATKTFSVPQADLDFVSGTLYDMETETYFRAAINAIMASEDGIVFQPSIDHNTDYTVVGVTYARKIEMINGYSVTFTPDSQWTARLQGSNNNLFDVGGAILNQNQVQVIPNNSAGLIQITSGSGVTAQDKLDIADRVWDEVRSTHATAGSYGESFFTMLSGTVDIATFTPTTTQFEADDVTEATADHFKDRVVIFTSGVLLRQAKEITAYSLVGGKGRFTVGTLTEAPGDDDTFIVV